MEQIQKTVSAADTVWKKGLDKPDTPSPPDRPPEQKPPEPEPSAPAKQPERRAPTSPRRLTAAERIQQIQKALHATDTAWRKHEQPQAPSPEPEAPAATKQPEPSTPTPEHPPEPAAASTAYTAGPFRTGHAPPLPIHLRPHRQAELRRPRQGGRGETEGRSRAGKRKRERKRRERPGARTRPGPGTMMRSGVADQPERTNQFLRPFPFPSGKPAGHLQAGEKTARHLPAGCLALDGLQPAGTAQNLWRSIAREMTAPQVPPLQAAA